ncbi:MAG: CinA family protein [Ruminococcus sp.]|nr:CinA family protein [Ruminococcus sp.]
MQNGHSSEYKFDNLDRTVTNVVELLKRMGLTASVAESCTGGLLSELITSVSGASDVFELGICTYSEKMKNQMLGVPMELIEKYGVVSSEVASSMVSGLKRISRADVCISVTGIAGPGGGTAETPVGTVYIGFDVCGEHFVRLPELWKLENKTRDAVRRSAAAYAFGIVEKMLMEAIQSNE